MGNRNVKKNTIYSIIKSCSTVLFPLITFPYISRILLTENVGKVNFGASIVNYFSLIASLGVTTYAVRECAKVREDSTALTKNASQIISLNICTTIIAYLGLFVLLLTARPLFVYRQLIVIQSTVILFVTFGADWLNTAMEDFRFITIRTVSFQILALMLMFFFVRKPEHYMRYAIITVISSSGGNIINIFYRRRYCKTGFTIHMDLQHHLPPVLKLFAMLLSQQIFCSSDTTMLGLMRGDYEVGLYSTSVKIYNIINSLMASITWVVMPQLSCAFEQKNYHNINKLLRYSLNFILTLGVPCIIIMNLLASEIIEIAAGAEYLGAVDSLRILSITLAVSLIWGFVMNIILLPSGMDGICLKACVWSAAFNLVTNMILIPYFGLTAAASTTAVSQLIGLIICLCHVDQKLSLKNLRSVFYAPFFGGCVMAVAVFAVSDLISNLWLRVIIAVGIGSLLYFIIQIIMKNAIVVDILNTILRKLK